jgi:hypothetical protein
MFSKWVLTVDGLSERCRAIVLPDMPFCGELEELTLARGQFVRVELAAGREKKEPSS